ncbi:MAG TPA: phosphatase PAP2 family protein [Kofleriaceae bacterium]
MTTQVAPSTWRVPTARETVRWLGPDGVLAVVAIGALAIISHALGGALHVPWDGILPFLAIGAVLLVASAAIDIMMRRPLGLVRTLRLWAPFSVVYLCYRALRGALPVLVDGGVERSLVSADRWLLGSSPAWSLAAIHTPWLTELLAYAYAMMFFLPLAVMLVLHAKRRDRELRGVALALQVAFYIGFTVFLLVPARSPDVVYDFPPLVGHGFYERSMAAWRSLQAVTYDAFPSMHTAISSLALISAFRLRLAIWKPMVPVVLLLQLATLYLRQHYFVDVMAGWAVAAVALYATRSYMAAS